MTTVRTDGMVESLFAGFEMSVKSWLVAAGVPGVDRIVRGEFPATNPAALREMVAKFLAKAKAKLGLPADAKVRSCYEAGRDGFWPHRMLSRLEVENLVVDPASIQVDRRRKHVKTDRIDASRLLAAVIRHHHALQPSERLRAVVVPTEEQEEQRLVNREQRRLGKEKQALVNRIKSHLAVAGARLPRKRGVAGAPEATDHEGRPLGEGLRSLIGHELERLKLVESQMKELEKRRRADVSKSTDAVGEQMRTLTRLKGIGVVAASVLGRELLWRPIETVRQLGGLSGLAPAPFQSGDTNHDQGVTKAGSTLVRWVMGQIAHAWVWHQPGSELTKWYRRRFGSGGAGRRKCGITALARKLLVALWKFARTGEVPAGAELKEVAA